MQIIDYRAPDAPKAFVDSLKATGFGVLSNHPISEARLRSLYADWQAFFDGDDKHQFAFDPEKQDGYFSPETSETAKGHAKKDLKEFYHVYPHGRVPSQLEEQTRSYYQDASELAEELLQWVEDHSPESVSAHYSEPLSAMIQNTNNTLLRVLHYPPLSGEEELGAVRAAAHEDINLITILPAASQPGLQVQTQTGDWMDIPSNFGNLIVNIGDMLQEASRGYFPSTSHRVVNPSSLAGNVSRISLPLFLHPRSEVVLSDRHTQKSYLDERLAELGIKPNKA